MAPSVPLLALLVLIGLLAPSSTAEPTSNGENDWKQPKEGTAVARTTTIAGSGVAAASKAATRGHNLCHQQPKGTIDVAFLLITILQQYHVDRCRVTAVSLLVPK
jgi:hypothetical protein